MIQKRARLRLRNKLKQDELGKTNRGLRSCVGVGVAHTLTHASTRVSMRENGINSNVVRDVRHKRKRM